MPMMWLFLTTACLIPGTLSAGGFLDFENKVNPEVWMNASEIIMYNGYPSEEYDVTTADGYILAINRIPHGRAQTGQTGFVAFSTMPELAQRIKMNFALGPVISFKYPTSVFTNLFLLPKSIIKLVFGTKGVLLEDKNARMSFITFCNQKLLQPLCSEFMSLWAGFNKKNMNMSRLDVYMAHAPTGSSIQNMLHIKQLYRSDEFRAYDWGSEAENMNHYNQSYPPLYDLTAMKVPTAIWAGGHDVLVTPQDVARILPQITNLRYFKQFPDWNHFDFVWGLDAPQRLYSKIISLMKEYF